MAGKQNISGRSKMNKEKLVKELADSQELQIQNLRPKKLFLSFYNLAWRASGEEQLINPDNL